MDLAWVVIAVLDVGDRSALASAVESSVGDNLQTGRSMSKNLSAIKGAGVFGSALRKRGTGEDGQE